MKLSVLLNESLIFAPFNPTATSKNEILKQLIAFLYRSGEIEDDDVTEKEMLNAVIEREAEQTTALGDGVAFPHARMDRLRGFYMVFAISKEGVEFGSLDGEKVHFFVMSICPREKPNLLLKTRAAITRFLMLENMQNLLKNISASQVWRILDDSDIQVNQRILAKDVMKKCVNTLSPDLTLSEVAAELHKHNTDALPVVDENGKFIKEFSCYDLFSYGIPKFFANLYSISYVKDMDPFEKYFLTDRTMKIGNIPVEKEQGVIGSRATIMEIIFEMTTHDRHCLYVIDENGLLLGHVDRYTIVDKILIDN